MIEARSRRDACCGEISNLCLIVLDPNLGMVEVLSRSSQMIKKRVVICLYVGEIALLKEARFGDGCRLKLTREEVTTNSLQT